FPAFGCDSGDVIFRIAAAGVVFNRVCEPLNGLRRPISATGALFPGRLQSLWFVAGAFFRLG
ncbi:MAG: hypothetical protein RL215_472, partial [Planctomycetota bacterium]